MARQKNRKSKEDEPRWIDRLKHSTGPVDPDFFMWCMNLFHAAAGLTMPTENRENRPLFEKEGKIFAFSDIPINRGMLAVSKELKERGADEATRMSMMFRIMHMSEIFESPELEDFFRPGDEPGAVDIASALLKACATARISVDADDMGFDIADVARLAREYASAEDEDKPTRP